MEKKHLCMEIQYGTSALEKLVFEFSAQLQYLPSRVETFYSQIFIPKKYIIINVHNIWVQKTLGKPPEADKTILGKIKVWQLIAQFQIRYRRPLAI